MSARIERATLEKYFHRTYGDQLPIRVGTIAIVAAIVAYVGALSVVLAAVWTVGYAAGELALMYWWRRSQPVLAADNKAGLRRMTGQLVALSAALSAYAVLPCLVTPFQTAQVAIVGAIVSAGILMTIAALHSLNRQIFLATAPLGAIALVMNLFALGDGLFSWLFAALGIFFVFNARSLQLANARSFEELIVHQVEAEDALDRLQESQNLYRLLADNQTDTISLWSEDWDNRYLSPSSERAFGFSIEERRSLPQFSNLHEDDRALFRAALATLKPGDPPRTVEVRTVDKQGRAIWLDNTVKRLDGADGGYLMTSRIITERKALEAELRLAIASLDPQPGARVLDAGCGTGEALRWFADAVGPAGTVVGIDLAAAHATAARACAPAQALVLQADLLHAPLCAGSFDRVWCMNTVNHLRDPLAGARYFADQHFPFIAAIGRGERQEHQAALFTALLVRLQELTREKLGAPLLILYSWPDEDAPPGDFGTERSQAKLVSILAGLRDRGLPLFSAERPTYGQPASKLMIPHEGHPTAFTVRLIAEALKKKLVGP